MVRVVSISLPVACSAFVVESHDQGACCSGTQPLDCCASGICCDGKGGLRLDCCNHKPAGVPSWWPNDFTFMPDASCSPFSSPTHVRNLTADLPQGCLKACRDKSDCQAFTHEAISKQCVLFQACAIGTNLNPALGLKLTSGSQKSPARKSAPMPNMCENSGLSDSGNWSRTFTDSIDLSKSPWGVYLASVYGEIPDNAFPFCTSELTYLDHLAAEKSGILDDLVQLVKFTGDPHAFGPDYFKHMNLSTPYLIDLNRYNDGLWIRRAKSPYNDVELGLAHDNQWIEVRHQAGGDTGEHIGMWLSYARGSGIWFNTGRTRVFSDHASASQELCGAMVPDDAIVACAKKAGNLDSIQFNYNWAIGEANFELIAVNYIGQYTCGTKEGGVLADFRSGWQASKPCICDNNYADKYQINYLNCQGQTSEPEAFISV